MSRPVFLFAAGYGKRLAPLTDTTPKPLMPVGNSTLIERLIRQLSAAGYQDILVNVCHLASQITHHIGDGSAYGVRIRYIDESPTPKETAGALHYAITSGYLDKQAPFLAINADIYTDFPFTSLQTQPVDWAHLVLVPNPPHQPIGDFSCIDGRIGNQTPKHTFSGIGVYHPEMILTDYHTPRLGVHLRHHSNTNRISGSIYRGIWHDAGTADRLQIVRGLALNST